MEKPPFSHSGANAGFRSLLFAMTKTGQGAFVMTNGDNGGRLAEEIMRGIVVSYNWPDFHVTEKALGTADANAYRAFAGHYIVGGGPVKVSAEGDRLFIRAQALGTEKLEVFPDTNGKFFITAMDA